MLAIWGTYAYQHPRGSATAELCESCGQAAVERRTIERTWHFIFMPLVPRALRAVTRCAHCKRVEVRPVDGDRPARAFTWRVAASWTLMAAMIATLTIGGVLNGRAADAWARAPVAGDQWTIATAKWTNAPSDMLAFARVRVEHVDGGQVALAACAYTADRAGAIEDKCGSYPLALDPVAVADVATLRDHGAIVSIWRGGDPAAPYEGAAAGLSAAAVVLGLLAWRAAKRSFAPDEALPTAAIAKR